MKTVKIITTPLSTGHAVRGVGFYTKHLMEHVQSLAGNFNLEIVDSQQADLVHYPFFDLFQPTLVVVPNQKTLVTIHDVIPLEYPDHYPPGIKGWVNLQRQKMTLKKVDRIITDSKASKSSIQKYLGIPDSKIDVVYLAASKEFKPLRVEGKYDLPEKFVLYVGDVNYNKNIPGLIEACKLAKMPLVLVGKQAVEIEGMDLTHPELAHLQDIDWTGVTRMGFVENLPEVYNLAAVYCQPSFAEGFGFPVLEALACGTPVACSKTSSLPEIAGNAVTYFDPLSVEEMAKALKNATDKGGVEQAKKFSWEKTAKETLGIYSQVLYNQSL